LLSATAAMPAQAQQDTVLPTDPQKSASQAAESEAAPSNEQSEGAPGGDLEDEEEIVVTGQVPRGSVAGDIPPEIQLDRRDIRAYGASNLAELLDALAPQTGSGRGDGAPVVLLNGRRISGFSEIRDLPPEAVERIDILPEEVALKYGYRADQRVVNFVLRQRFRAITGELEGGLATDGGRGTVEAEANVVRIDRAGRWTIDAKYERQSSLLESQRDIVQGTSALPYDLTGNISAPQFGQEIDPGLSALLGRPVTVAGVRAPGGVPLLSDFTAAANATDLRPYRTLLPQTDEASINATYNRTIFGNVSATLNASYERTSSTSRFGLPSAAFDLPAGNPYSPFANDVVLYRLFDGAHPLTQQASAGTGHVGISLNGDMSKWRWSLTGNYDRVRSLTRTDTGLALDNVVQRILDGDATLNPFGQLPETALAYGPRDRARSLNQSGDIELVATGSLFSLPAGDASSTFKIGVEARGFDSDTLRNGVEGGGELSRTNFNGQASFDLPIASRRNDVLAAIGDLSANGNVAVDRLSDFGSLITYGGGINWSPIKPLRIIASFTQEEGAPSVQQLGNPVILVPNVRVFDFTRGVTADITRIDGGNPDLGADSRRVFKLGLTLKPITETDLTLRADYVRTRTRNMIASFPTATPEIEAAFPDRFIRDDDGRLLTINARPVNFARADTAEIRWGFNFSKPIASRNPFRGARGGDRPGGWRSRRDGGDSGQGAQGTPGTADGAASGSNPGATQTGTPPTGEGSTSPLASGAAPPESPGRGGGGFGRGLGRFGRGGAGQGGRLQFALFHTWRIQDEVLIRDGVAKLDFLNGSAVGNSGGRARHEIEAQAGISKNGFGARLTADWQSGTTVRGDPGLGSGNGSSDLRFSDLATVNLRLFADLGQQPFARQNRWLRGARVSLKVNNLFNDRPKVRDASGATPLSYQPAYLDPLGRSVSLSFRKMFF
jgi:hypothetical protein